VARTRTASAPSRAAACCEHSTRAAPPSLTGEHMSSVSGGEISRLASTSSTVRSPPYCALGLSLPLPWFLVTTLAKSVGVAPLRSMYRRVIWA
jgi:hypothetical protein